MAGLFAIAAVVVGCSDGGSSEPAIEGANDTGMTELALPEPGWSPVSGDHDTPSYLPDEDIDQWVLPLDSYHLTQREWEITTYAENLLIVRCQGEAGFPVDLPPHDVDLPLGATENSQGRHLFDIEIAQTYGYHEDVVVQPNLRAMLALESEPWTAEQEAVYLDCRNRARQILPLPKYSQLADMEHIGRARQESLVDPEVITAAQNWRECMAAAGIGDLPEDPAQMPPSWMAEEVAGNARPSAEEIELATADAKCRDSSGYRQALYDAEWRAQLQAWVTDGETLENDRTAARQYLADAFEIINAHENR